jgi:hypothetical protein
MTMQRSAAAVHTAGTAFLVAGIAGVVAFLAGYLPVPGIGLITGLIPLVTDIALAVALAAFGTRVFRNRPTRIAFLVGAVGWALVALLTLIPVPGLDVLALLAAGAGSLAGGILVYRGGWLAPGESGRVLVAMIGAALVTLGMLIPGLPAGIFTLAFGVALLVAGIALRNA